LVTLHYRVYEPGTPRELPLELVQEWESDLPLEVGHQFVWDDGKQWILAEIADDPDPHITARVYFVASVVGS
jgi:hypothetical protein